MTFFARYFPLPGATPAQAESLAQSCQKATFGVNQQDVLDESYRKAGKMDVENFALNFNPVSSGLLKHVKERLFSVDFKPREVRAELYKLNVYGE